MPARKFALSVCAFGLGLIIGLVTNETVVFVVIAILLFIAWIVFMSEFKDNQEFEEE